ncbi:MAG: hypothetical protein KKD05_10650 [Candidatus Omnitrophica bacterium]|nr:hypothetical protein [Candidatus Omnitrophota bacterium]
MKLVFKKILLILIKIIQIPLNIVLALLYFLLILPYAFVYRKSFVPEINSAAAAKNNSKHKPRSFWLDVNPADPSLENLRRQY